MLHLRPRNRFEDLDGVYLVGGGTHPGSGLPVIYESARITSRLIQEDLAACCSSRRCGSPPPASTPAPKLESDSQQLAGV
jgi:phytoene desaturase